jgi:hypothetical protein
MTMKMIVCLSIMGFVAVVSWLHGYYVGRGKEDRES